MSDRFKFRAWDNEAKEMTYDGVNKRNKDPKYPFDFNLKEMSKEPRYVIMQCTGLKDKNDKLIYEGDILYHKYYYCPEMSLARFEEEEYREVKFPDFFYYLGSDEICNSPETIEEFVSHMEIVGNRCQNPELLNNKESDE